MELAPLAELALEKLKNLLLVMSAAGAFAPGEETIGAELWALTWAVVGERFRFCPGLREELFGGLEVAGVAPQPAQQQEEEEEEGAQEEQRHSELLQEEEPLAAELMGPLPPEEQEGEAAAVVPPPMPPSESSSFAAVSASEEDPAAAAAAMGGAEQGGEGGDVSSLFPPMPPREAGGAVYGEKGLPPGQPEAPIPEGADRRGAGMAAQIV